MPGAFGKLSKGNFSLNAKHKIHVHSTLDERSGCGWKLNKPWSIWFWRTTEEPFLPFLGVDTCIGFVSHPGTWVLHTSTLLCWERSAVCWVAAPHSYSELLQHLGVAVMLRFLWKSEKILPPPFVSFVEAQVEPLEVLLRRNQWHFKHS